MSNTIAIYNVNNYILETIPTLFKYTTGNKPIVPIQDVPEAKDFPGPYITYSVRTTIDPNQWWVSTDDVIYMIWDRNLNNIQPIVNELIDIFRRMDESATDLNEYVDSINNDDFNYLSFQIVDTVFPNPVAGEGERYGQPFNFKYKYMVNSGRGIQ